MKNRTRTEKKPQHSPLWRLMADKPCIAGGATCRGKKSVARPHALLCDRHGLEWAECSGRFAGLPDEQRQALEAVWIRVANEMATPETVAQARALERRGLGRLGRDENGKHVWAGACFETLRPTLAMVEDLRQKYLDAKRRAA